MNIDSPEFGRLRNLILDSFRVRKNQRPLYVDIGTNLERISAAQHQVVFGRRGSGKSCLFVHFLRSDEAQDVAAMYILADEYKRLTYPDILIRLLVEILEQVPVRWRLVKRLLRRDIPTERHARELRRLLDQAEESQVIEDKKRTSERKANAVVGNSQVGKAAVSSQAATADGRTSTFKERKLDTLERHLRDYKLALSQAVAGCGKARAYLFIDDFYLVPREWHPDVLDYLHRLVRDTEVFLKLGTIRHRTQLARNQPQTIGVELAQDVEEINLDRTLEDLGATQQYLGQMLDLIANKAGIQSLLTENLNPEGLEALALASGGVPRDFLNIFVEARQASVGDGKVKWLTPKYIYRSAGRLSYQTKLKNLRDDAGEDTNGLDRLLTDLLTFCLKEKRKTAFLISQEEAQELPREHELIQQLMDFKLIHVVEPDTSAASSRAGRYEAYTLDFSLFMEPRRRGIEIVEFWKLDEDSHRSGLREAPVYSLHRAGEAFRDVGRAAEPEVVLDDAEDADGEDSRTKPARKAPARRSGQQELFGDTPDNG